MLGTALEHIDDLADFVSVSPTSYHAAAEIARRLERAGFERVDAAHPFGPSGGRRFVVRDGAVVAWIAPGALTDGAGFRIVGTHTDSPGFKVKPGPLPQSAGWTGVGVEVYGGPLLNSWLDRDLGIAGRIVTLDGAAHLVRSGPIARIPQLAIHLDRTANEALKLDRQAHTQPILAVEPRGSLLDHLCGLAGIDADQVARGVPELERREGGVGGDHEGLPLDALDRAGVVNPIVCANINKAGFRMSGGIEAYREALEQRPFRGVAMSVFASGAIPPREFRQQHGPCTAAAAATAPAPAQPAPQLAKLAIEASAK